MVQSFELDRGYISVVSYLMCDRLCTSLAVTEQRLISPDHQTTHAANLWALRLTGCIIKINHVNKANSADLTDVLCAATRSFWTLCLVIHVPFRIDHVSKAI